MKKILLLGEDESNSFLLQKLQDEGCDCKILTRYANGTSVLPRVGTVNEALSWGPDFVICDSRGYAPFLKRFRDSGAGVLGGGPYTDKLDADVITSLEYLQAAGVPTIDYQKFDDAAVAIEYVTGNNKPWRLTLGPENSEGFQNGNKLAEDIQKRYDANTLPPQFIMHKDFPGIDDHGGLRMWCNFHVVGFVHEKGLMNPCFAMELTRGNTGIPTLEGVTMFPLPVDSPLIQLTLGKVAQPLGKLNYVGPVTLGCVVQPPDYTSHWDEDEGINHWDEKIVVQRMNLTPPPGFWAAFCAGLEMDMHFFLDRLCTPARNGNPFDFWQGVVSSRKLTLPPYPLSEAAWLSQEQRTTSLQFMPKVKIPYKPNVYWNGVKPSGDEVIPVSPVLGYLTGKARNARDSVRQIRDEFDGLQIPYAQVNDSLNECFEVDLFPTKIAERQLSWEEEKEDVYRSAIMPSGKRVKVVSANGR